MTRRTRIAIVFVILIAGPSCGPISDWPRGEGDEDGPSLTPGVASDAGVAAPQDAGASIGLDAGVGLADAGAGGSTSEDASAVLGCNPDAGDAGVSVDASNDAGPDAGLDPHLAARPLPPLPDAQVMEASAPLSDAAAPDAMSAVADVLALPCL